MPIAQGENARTSASVMQKKPVNRYHAPAVNSFQGIVICCFDPHRATWGQLF
jgi:hypothetical protein